MQGEIMTRTGRRLYWLIIGLALGLTIPWLFVDPAYPQELSFGGGVLNGHSYDRDYSIDTGKHFAFTLEESYIKWDHKINVGLMYLYSHYTRTNNEPQKELKIDAHVITAFVKPYWRLTESFQPFVLAGVGAAIDRYSSRASLTTGLGLDYWLTDRWALSPSLYLIVTETNNFKVGLISIKYSF